MSVLQGASEGFFVVFVLITFFLFVGWSIETVMDVSRYRKGLIRFTDLYPFAQWIVLTFFNDHGDGGGFV